MSKNRKMRDCAPSSFCKDGNEDRISSRALSKGCALRVTCLRGSHGQDPRQIQEHLCPSFLPANSGSSPEEMRQPQWPRRPWEDKISLPPPQAPGPGTHPPPLRSWLHLLPDNAHHANDTSSLPGCGTLLLTSGTRWELLSESCQHAVVFSRGAMALGN